MDEGEHFIAQGARIAGPVRYGCAPLPPAPGCLRERAPGAFTGLHVLEEPIALADTVTEMTHAQNPSLIGVPAPCGTED